MYKYTLISVFKIFFSCPFLTCFLSLPLEVGHIFFSKNRNRSDGLDPFYTCLFQALTTHLFMGAARRGTHRAGAVRADTLGGSWQSA